MKLFALMLILASALIVGCENPYATSGTNCTSTTVTDANGNPVNTVGCAQ